MKKVALLISIIFVSVGCSNHAIKAWQLSNFEKTLGAPNPNFILNFETLTVTTGIIDSESWRHDYADMICRYYNSDKQLRRLEYLGLLANAPTCVGVGSKENSLNIEVGTTKTWCFMGCLDRYMTYRSGSDQLAHFEIKHTPVMEAIDVSVGHIKNLIIAANIQKHKHDPEWVARLKAVCKSDKKLRGFCG